MCARQYGPGLREDALLIHWWFAYSAPACFRIPRPSLVAGPYHPFVIAEYTRVGKVLRWQVDELKG